MDSATRPTARPVSPPPACDADGSTSCHSPQPASDPPLSEQHLPDGKCDPTNVPPVFWARHGRTVSSASYRSIQQPPPIQLEDRSQDSHELALSCWAKSATVDEYVLVSGSNPVGAYVVWHCTIKTLKGGDLNIRKRYSEFDLLRANLVQSFPHAEAMIPLLPRKSIVSRFRPDFLEHRKQGLAHFLNCILLNPEFASSPLLKDFIFG